jgi:hypothetical protein
VLILDPLTLQLFGKFPREVGIRSNIYTLEAFEKYLLQNEGITDCYTSIYTLNGEIDKIFFDFDGKGSGLDDAKRVYRWLVAERHSVVAVASGKKGIHIYVLLKPIPTTKEVLTQATWGILKAVFGDGYTKTMADPHCIGDIRRISRIPNTRRPPLNNTWCTPLPAEFINFSWGEVIQWTKMPHEFSTARTPTQTILDLPLVQLSEVRNITPALMVQPFKPSSSNSFLQSVLRPCLYNGITVPNPVHGARVAATIDLLQNYSFSPEQIADFYQDLNWLDWSRQTTIDQIKSCLHLTRTFSCGRLRAIGMCMYNRTSDCPHRNEDMYKTEVLRKE